MDEAEIVALFVESVLYGILVVTFVACVYTLVWRRNSRRLNVPMLATAILLFVCATMHVAIDLVRMLNAFWTHRAAPGGPAAYFNDVRRMTHVFKSAVYITETCISDALVVYRCHVVVKRYLVTFCLSVMVIGSAVSGYGSVYMLVHSPNFHGSIFNSRIAPWITSFNVITAATNILATILIAYTIWRLNRIVTQVFEGHSLSPVMLIIIESGAIYGFALLLLTAFYTRDSNAQFIVLDAISPLIGIVFCHIILRVSLQAKNLSADTTTRPNQPHWLWTTHPGITQDLPGSMTVTALGLGPESMIPSQQPEVIEDKEEHISVSVASPV